MSIIVAAGLALLIAGIMSEKWGLVRHAVGLVAIVLITVALLAYARRDDDFLKIPGTRIDNSGVVEVSNDGSMYLDSSSSAFIPNKFFLDSNNSDELSEWLSETEKTVHLYIVKGNKTLYSQNLGLYSSGMEKSIRSIYASWKADGVVPSDAIRYWFLFFYLEV